MDQELLLNPSDSNLFEEVQQTPEASASSPSPNIQHFQQPRLCSAIHIPQHSRFSSSDNSNIIGPLPSRRSNNRQSHRGLSPPRQHSDHLSTSNISKTPLSTALTIKQNISNCSQTCSKTPLSLSKLSEHFGFPALHPWQCQ